MAEPSAEAVALARKFAPCWCVSYSTWTQKHCNACKGAGVMPHVVATIDEALTRARAEGRREGLQTSFDECTAVLDDDGQPDVVLGVALCQSRIGACLEAEGVTMPKVQPHGMQCGACSADNCAECSGWCFCRECGGDK